MNTRSDRGQATVLTLVFLVVLLGMAALVLDIGCGWGATLEYLARERHVKRAHGITLSRAQHEEVMRRKLEGVEAWLVDYKDFVPAEKYDALIATATAQTTKAARAAGIPVWKREDAWRELGRGKRVVAVAGTHGKALAA